MKQEDWNKHPERIDLTAKKEVTARPETITQENLPAALKDGRITQTEVDQIWNETSFMSAQTPIEFRTAFLKLRGAGYTLDPVMTMVMSTMLDIRAEMTRDESKFAHLVAGTETIVKTLQNVNPLVRRLDRQEMMIDSLSDQLERAEAKIDTLLQAMAEGGKLELKHEVLRDSAEVVNRELLAQELDTLAIGTRAYNALNSAGIKTVGQLVEWSMADLLRKVKNLGKSTLQEVVEVLDELGLKLAGDTPRDEAEFLAQTAADALGDRESTMTDEPYDGNVGSAWDPKNPAKGPVPMPSARQEYETGKAKHEEMELRHRETQNKDFRDRVLKHS